MDFSVLPSFLQLGDFHFLRPVWFLALIPLLLLLIWLKRNVATQSGWQAVIPPHLYQHMIIGKTEKGQRPPLWMLALVWFISVVALAGPTWERLPQPVYQLKMGHVIVLDMSLSMRATDMTPDRLTRAKYKAIDLVNALGEGEMGLVAYAGDAFVISPLTEDANNITALLPSLSPEIMPVPGSDPLLGIESAAQLLNNAGYNSGMIYWITDGIDFQQQKELQEYVSSIPFTVNALTVGTSQGAPIRQLSGELLKDASGSIVIPKLNNSAVSGVVKASGGSFETFTSNDNDINALASLSLSQRKASDEEKQEDNNQGDQWKEVGAYLVLAMLPFAALAFRKGLLFILLVGILSPTLPVPAHAQQNTNVENSLADRKAETSLSWWQKPFLNDDQEAHSYYENERFEDASSQFNDPTWKASALYKSGEYEKALDAYDAIEGADSLYNQGNALAKLGRFEEAIEKYSEALSLAPDMQDAASNKALLEELLKQQEQQNQDNQQSDDQQQDSDDSQSSEQNGESDQPKDGSEQQQNQNSDGQNQQDNNDDAQQDNGQDQNQQKEQSQSQESEQQDQDDKDASQQQDDTDDSNDEQQQAENRESQQDQNANAEAMQAQQGELTDAEKEELQRMESLMRRVPDDPAFLLKRKMQLEAQKRQRQRMPSNRSDW